MRDLKRVIHVDFHTMPGIYNFNERFNAEDFAKTLYEAHVKYVNVFCKCNIGFAYYDTKIGIPYPNMKGDMFGDILRECHKYDIGVSAYFNVGLDHEQAKRHRDWVTLESDGKLYKDNKVDSFFRTMCYHTPYRDYIKGMIKEVVDNYDIDGIFLDCFDVRPCVGNECIVDMKKLGFDPSNEKDVYEFARKDYLDFCSEIKQIVGKDKYFYINGWRDFTANKVLQEEVHSHAEIEGLPSSLGYDYYATNVAYARVLKEKVLNMTGRFQFSWSDFGGYKGKASLENDMWDSLLNGAEYCIGDHMNPAGNLDKAIYSDIGEIYKDLEKYEEYTLSSKYVADIAVMTDKKVYEQRYFGISRLLNELKYTYDFVDEDIALDKYKAVILPDEMRISTSLAEKLEAYMAQGKCVLCVGEGGLNEDGTGFALKEDLHEFCGLDNSTRSFFKALDKELNDTDFVWSMYSSGILFKSKDFPRATYIKGYFNEHWDYEHCYVYLPPEKATEYAVVSRSKNVFRVCFKLFNAYREFAMKTHKDIIHYCLKKMIDTPSIVADELPSTARIGLTESAKTMQVHIKTTYPEKRGDLEIVEEHQYLPKGKVVKVKGQYKTAFEPLSKRTIETQYENGYTTIVLPEIYGYMMIILEK